MRPCLVLAVLLVGCGGDPVQTINLSVQVSGQPFDCTASYDGIGLSKTTIKPRNLRLYVHDVQLVRAGGEREPLKLVPDGTWQSDRVAFLDFEDGRGTCHTGSPETNAKIVGRAPPHSDYVGLEFTVGVPEDLNHLDAPTAEPPLDVPGMWWDWAGGYRFVKIDVQSTKNDAWYFHLGGTGCSGTVSSGLSCKYTNRPVIHLDGFQMAKNTVVLDLASLYANSDLDAQIDNVTDYLPGCMSDETDPECGPLFATMGMTFDSTTPGPAQQLFRVQ